MQGYIRVASPRVLLGLRACPLAVLLVAASVAPGTDLDKVLVLTESRTGPRSLAVDRGAAGLWQHLQRLQTTASVLYTAAHPDDEQGGTLTHLSRGQGVRTSLLTLNRGEAGANAVGSELFDGLGLIRTEELLVSDRYYGLDDQYFTTLIDYGYSKIMSEALRQWGRENVLRDVVRVIRINRPLVLVSRFYGDPRDGHGNHETSGAVTQEAYALAGDPTKFPEQIQEEGLRPWQPLKLYRSNLRSRRSSGPAAGPPDHQWHVRVNAGAFSPWLGQTYDQFAALGLSFQRSQTSGRMRERIGNQFHYFERLESRVRAPDRENGFFDGVDTSVGGMFGMLGGEAPEGMTPLLAEIEGSVEEAVAAFSVTNPAAAVPFLVRGLKLTREAAQLGADHDDAGFLLAIKERQFQDAISASLGLQLRAVAVPSGSGGPSSPFSAPATLGEVVPGQQFKVETTLVNPSSLGIHADRISLDTAGNWSVVASGPSGGPLRAGEVISASFSVTVPADATLARRYFVRGSVRDSRYTIREPEFLHLPGREPALRATAEYTIEGEEVRATAVVHRREANLPFGYEYREVKVAPALAVNVSPANLIAPLGSARTRLSLEVELENNHPDGSEGDLVLEVPEGWSAQPDRHSFRFSQASARQRFGFEVSAPRIREETYELAVVARSGGREYRQGYRAIRHRDLDTRYLYSDSTTSVRGVNVKIAPGMTVGYVMGVGDEVPSGIEQMGAQVTLLGADELANSDLSTYGAIVVGTRAYAVRPDLISYNQRLLDYAHQGGNLIILYQTQEFVPSKWAAFPADLPRRAEEVSEEDSPVKILAPDHPVLQGPNKIEAADFEGWVEQRGSKFFSAWDDSYLPLIETQDEGQDPQRGGWLTAPYGNGHYTYFAYAIHRQVPYSVPGPYRIFANVLSLGR
ncbi:MAG: PIG-L family deacetylase [Bryobacterales bacterium]|nr:PIG-L family deacetylase [Bryobacterales bacterium]